MFPLRARSLPPDAQALRDALEESLSQLVTRPGQEMVAVEDRDYPELAAIRISLHEAQLGDRPPNRPPPVAGAIEPALQVEHFELTGRPVRIQGAAIELSCVASDVQIGQAPDRDGNLVLLLRKATNGTLKAAVSVADLQDLVRSGASAAARKQGIILENLRLRLEAQTERSLDLEVRIRARKLFLSTEVRITGRVAVDENLNAQLSGLQCFAEGTLGTLACGFLTPHLQRFNNREFSLAALPLGELQLHDVRIAVGDQLRVTAQFGS